MGNFHRNLGDAGREPGCCAEEYLPVFGLWRLAGCYLKRLVNLAPLPLGNNCFGANHPGDPRMTTRRPAPDLALRCLPAALLAVQICVFGVAGQALAQSATVNNTNPSNDSALLDRTRTKLRTTSKSDPNAVEDADPDTATPPGANPAENDEVALDAAALKEMRRQNEREPSVDGLPTRLRDDNQPTSGIPLGSFTFRPTISESLGMERTKTGKKATERTFLQTGFKGSLVSDWSLHQLKIDTEGTWQKTLSGTKSDDPVGRIDAELRLDLMNDTVARLRAGYSLQREDIGDPNAVSNASNQALVSTYTASAEVTHDLGLIRGTAGIDFARETYGEATLESGTVIDQSDRNNNEATLRGRIGYELSPALIPFLQASYGKAVYDNEKDATGYVRDATIYALKAGVAGDFGDKLRGELSTGYALAEFDDSRLKAIDAWTIDGNVAWSPQRGTDVAAGLKTEIEPSTTAGASGSTAYTADAALTQVIIEQLSGRLSTSLIWRDYAQRNVPNQTVYNAGAGLTWGVARSIDLTADVAWERTLQEKTPNQNVMTGMIGIALKR